MLGVKLTILMIIMTFIMKYIIKCMLIKEDEVDLYLMAEGKKVTWYTVLLGFMIIFDFIGILYSVIYLLFLR